MLFPDRTIMVAEEADNKNPKITIMKKTKINIFILVFIVCFQTLGFASNVQVSNIYQDNIDADNQRISFNIQWDDSWRKDSEEPSNYDGVWIFIKYRDCLEKASGTPGDYNHCWISTTAADHTINTATVNGVPVTMEVEVGLTNISGTDRGMGIFIYQPAGDRVGSVVIDSLSILWKSGDHSPAENTSINTYDIQVVAVEMVNIPTSGYYLGDGVSSYYFRNPTDANKPIYINSNSMNILAEQGGLYQLTPNSGGAANISNNFPIGYDSYWAMKYEISQEQYMQFLNTLSRSSQRYRIATAITPATSNVSNVYIMANSASLQYRNAIVCEPVIPVGGDPVVFKMDYNGNRVYNEADDGANIACNYLSAHDITAYLDWAALRPLTEFEYEKMARGPYIGSYGYSYQKAWGTATINEVTGITNPGTATEASSNTGQGICVYNDNASVAGPLRCGFASNASTADRYTCGASFYGIFELSGNVREPYMGIWNNTNSDDNFGGESGDGLLNETGDANQASWPQGADGSGTTQTYIYYRGGDWRITDPNAMTISYRNGWDPTTQRYDYTGGRGGRFVTK
jgi:formylglycine-generating enzyme required for sulfatase activity